jgi:hypothetical protein
MFLLYSLSLGAPIWPIGVGGPRVRPVQTHSSYATGMNRSIVAKHAYPLKLPVLGRFPLTRPDRSERLNCEWKTKRLGFGPI